MLFEEGKFYKHTTGRMIAVLGELSTTMYGRCLIAEEAGYTNFVPVGRDSDATVNWTEITEEEWLKNFTKKDQNVNKPYTEEQRLKFVKVLTDYPNGNGDISVSTIILPTNDVECVGCTCDFIYTKSGLNMELVKTMFRWFKNHSADLTTPVIDNKVIDIDFITTK